MPVLALGSPLASAPRPARVRPRRRARPCSRLRLFAGDEAAPTSTFVEPTETPIAINGWPGRIVSWTAEEWESLGSMRPTGTMRLAAGVRALFFAD